MPELDLHLHAHQPSGFPKGMELACEVPAGTALSDPPQGCSHQSTGQAPACLRGTAELQLEQAQRRAKGSESWHFICRKTEFRKRHIAEVADLLEVGCLFHGCKQVVPSGSIKMRES